MLDSGPARITTRRLILCSGQWCAGVGFYQLTRFVKHLEISQLFVKLFGCLKSAMVRVFIPWISPNSANQVLGFFPLGDSVYQQTTGADLDSNSF